MTETKLQPLNTGGPRVLLTSTNRWPLVPRLVISLRHVGCTVAVICGTRHPVQKLSNVGPVYRYNGLKPIDSLKSAIEAVDPELIIPCCDRSVQHLHELYDRSQSDVHGRTIAALIERSLGSPSAYPIVTSRFRLLEIARSEGVLVPGTAAIESEADLRHWTAKSEAGWIMKADGTWGGQGVKIVSSAAEARRSFLRFSQRTGVLELIPSLVLNSDRDWLVFDWRNSRRPVIAQSIISGRPANCAVFCWRGRVLAGIAVEVIQSCGEMGPATVVQVVPGSEMMTAATKIARRLGISGLFGLDFMIDKESGLPYLIEMNPRCTPPCPLPLGEGHDLMQAMRAQLGGQLTSNSRPAITQSVIKYFPPSDNVDNVGDPNLSDLIYCDVPKDEPKLIRELLHARAGRSIVGKMVDLIRGKRSQERKHFVHHVLGDEKRNIQEEYVTRVLA